METTTHLVDEPAPPASEIKSSVASLGAAAAVVAQLEFYLSSTNLPFDLFLFRIWAASFHSLAPLVLATPPPKDYVHPLPIDPKSKHSPFHLGWVRLDTFTSFARLEPLLAGPDGLGSLDAIAEAVRNSHSEFIEVEKFGTEWFVRRTKVLERPDELEKRTVAISGFLTPKDGERKTVEEDRSRIEAWAQTLGVGEVRSVRMKREGKPSAAQSGSENGDGGASKVSILIEFNSAASVDQLLALVPAPTFEGRELVIQSQSELIKSEKSAPATGPTTKRLKKPNVFNAWTSNRIPLSMLPSPTNNPTKSKKLRPTKSKPKRKAIEFDDAREERLVKYDGVKFTALREGELIFILGLESVGHDWNKNKLLRFTIARSDGTVDDGDKEELGEGFNFSELKKALVPVSNPRHVELLPEFRRKIAPLPSALSLAKMELEHSTVTDGENEEATMAVDPKDPVKLGANKSTQIYPAVGQATFKSVVTDAMLERIRDKVAQHAGRNVEWTRATPEEERVHAVSRAMYHAKEAFVESPHVEPKRGVGRGSGKRGSGIVKRGGFGGRSRGGSGQSRARVAYGGGSQPRSVRRRLEPMSPSPECESCGGSH
ncbi:hypothetical protein RQP46_005861 [Phenoliferia psychrophenolica]